MSEDELADCAPRRAAFERLLDGVSRLAQVDKSIARSEWLGVIAYTVAVGNTTACMTYLPAPGQEHFNLVVDAGPAPPLERLDLWRGLMETNFSLVSHPQDACLCCDEQHERLQVRFACRVDAVDARCVLGLIQDGVQAAQLYTGVFGGVATR
jgi:hypothetical protein